VANNVDGAGPPAGCLRGASATVWPDHIEAGTFAALAAACRGDVTIRNVIPQHLEMVLLILRKMGVNLELLEGAMRVRPSELEAAPKIQTGIWPDKTVLVREVRVAVLPREVVLDRGLPAEICTNAARRAARVAQHRGVGLRPRELELRADRVVQEVKARPLDRAGMRLAVSYTPLTLPPPSSALLSSGAGSA